MTLISSISGIRGTIGGKAGEGLNPPDLVHFSSAFGTWIKRQHPGKQSYTIVLGRDARISGEMVGRIVTGCLQAMGINIINIGLATTPTTEIAVVDEQADGGIILTASHNPENWNALKLLNAQGEFLTAADGQKVLKLAAAETDFSYAEFDKPGKLSEKNYLETHIRKIQNLALVNIEAISKSGFKVAIDCVNSVGGIIIPELLKETGVSEVFELFCEPTGKFPHNPEPLPEHLTEISKKVKESGADVGFVVDPDVDRLAIINEDGSMFGEENTIAAVAEYVLQHKQGNTVSNLSSSRVLKDITEKFGGRYFASAVGEVNVVAKMKEVNAVIGGEGNGGVIYPELHYGRDALVGIALFLSYLAVSGKKCSEIKAGLPEYHISKSKIQLSPELDVDKILENIKNDYKDARIITTDGVKLDFENEWIHLRKSNTEPIIRIYAESKTKSRANEITKIIEQKIKRSC